MDKTKGSLLRAQQLFQVCMLESVKSYHQEELIP